jgi:hypothetical protein
MHETVAAVCAEHGLEHLSDSIISALAEEPFLGSAFDVAEALNGVLDGVVDEGLAATLFRAYSRCASGRKRPKVEVTATDAPGSSALDQFAWKREYKSSHERFEQPYTHNLGGVSLSLAQAPFNPEGFASTVRLTNVVPYSRACLDLFACADRRCGTRPSCSPNTSRRRLTATLGRDASNLVQAVGCQVSCWQQ